MRNMRTTNSEAFKLLIQDYEGRVDKTASTGIRYIKTNDSEKEWLQKLKIGDTQLLTQKITACVIDYNGEVYFALIGASIDTHVDPSLLLEVELNAGIITVLLSVGLLNINSSINLLEFEENILSQHEADDYSGHSYDELLPFLQPVMLYKIPPKSVFEWDCNIYRISTYIFSTETAELSLNYKTNTLNQFVLIASEGVQAVPYENIFNSMISVNWKYSFLELYRSIERLFPITDLQEFYKQSNISMPFLDFAAKIEDVLNWKPKEDDAIKKIFDNCREDLKIEIKAWAVKVSGNKDTEPSKYIYKLRNSIVHFRAKHENIDCQPDDWDELVCVLLKHIDFYYTEYENIIDR